MIVGGSVYTHVHVRKFENNNFYYTNNEILSLIISTLYINHAEPSD